MNRRKSTLRKFDNDMKMRSFLEKDMTYIVAGQHCSKLFVEVNEIIVNMENEEKIPF